MAHRNIERIILYPNGLVICRDKDGRQAPPLQGYFRDVISTIRHHFDPDDVSWCTIEKDGMVTKEVALPFNEWLELGGKLGHKSLEEKPIPNNQDEHARLVIPTQPESSPQSE